MKLLNDVQEGSFQKISGDLKQAREEKSLSLEEVAIRTLVPLSALQAIDEAQVEKLPEPIYVQGFVRRYGDAVGLDGKKLAAEFAEACLPIPEPVNLSDAKVKPGISLSVVAPYIIFISLVAAASLGLYYAINWQRADESIVENAVGEAEQTNSPGFETPAITSSASQPVEVEATASPEVSPTIIPTPVARETSESTVNSTPQPTPTPINQANAGSVKVKLDIKETSWIRVKVDGETAFEGTLKPGDVKNWAGEQEISIESGNAGGVLVSENEKPPEPMGEMYDVVRKRYEAPLEAIATPTSESEN